MFLRKADWSSTLNYYYPSFSYRGTFLGVKFHKVILIRSSVDLFV